MTTHPADCPQLEYGFTRPISALCRPTVALEHGPCLRCERGQALASIERPKRRPDAMARGAR